MEKPLYVPGKIVRASKPLPGLEQLVSGRSDFFAELAQNVGMEVQRLLRYTLMGYANPLTPDVERKAEADITSALTDILQQLADYVESSVKAIADHPTDSAENPDVAAVTSVLAGQLDASVTHVQKLEARLEEEQAKALRLNQQLKKLRTMYQKDLDFSRDRFRAILSRHLATLSDAELGKIMVEMGDVEVCNFLEFYEDETKELVTRTTEKLKNEFNLERLALQAQIRALEHTETLLQNDLEELQRESLTMQLQFRRLQGQHDHDTPSGSQQSGRGASKQQALVDKYSILMRKVEEQLGVDAARQVRELGGLAGVALPDTASTTGQRSRRRMALEGLGDPANNTSGGCLGNFFNTVVQREVEGVVQQPPPAQNTQDVLSSANALIEAEARVKKAEEEAMELKAKLDQAKMQNQKTFDDLRQKEKAAKREAAVEREKAATAAAHAKAAAQSAQLANATLDAAKTALHNHILASSNPMNVQQTPESYQTRKERRQKAREAAAASNPVASMALSDTASDALPPDTAGTESGPLGQTLAEALEPVGATPCLLPPPSVHRAPSVPGDSAYVSEVSQAPSAQRIESPLLEEEDEAADLEAQEAPLRFESEAEAGAPSSAPSSTAANASEDPSQEGTKERRKGRKNRGAAKARGGGKRRANLPEDEEVTLPETLPEVSSDEEKRRRSLFQRRGTARTPRTRDSDSDEVASPAAIEADIADEEEKDTMERVATLREPGSSRRHTQQMDYSLPMPGQDYFDDVEDLSPAAQRRRRRKARAALRKRAQELGETLEGSESEGSPVSSPRGTVFLNPQQTVEHFEIEDGEEDQDEEEEEQLDGRVDDEDEDQDDEAQDDSDKEDEDDLQNVRGFRRRRNRNRNRNRNKHQTAASPARGSVGAGSAPASPRSAYSRTWGSVASGGSWITPRLASQDPEWSDQQQQQVRMLREALNAQAKAESEQGQSHSSGFGLEPTARTRGKSLAEEAGSPSVTDALESAATDTQTPTNAEGGGSSTNNARSPSTVSHHRPPAIEIAEDAAQGQPGGTRHSPASSIDMLDSMEPQKTDTIAESGGPPSQRGTFTSVERQSVVSNVAVGPPTWARSSLSSGFQGTSALLPVLQTRLGSMSEEQQLFLLSLPPEQEQRVLNMSTEKQDVFFSMPVEEQHFLLMLTAEQQEAMLAEPLESQQLCKEMLFQQYMRNAQHLNDASRPRVSGTRLTLSSSLWGASPAMSAQPSSNDPDGLSAQPLLSPQTSLNLRGNRSWVRMDKTSSANLHAQDAMAQGPSNPRSCFKLARVAGRLAKSDEKGEEAAPEPEEASDGSGGGPQVEDQSKTGPITLARGTQTDYGLRGFAIAATQTDAPPVVRHEETRRLTLTHISASHLKQMASMRQHHQGSRRHSRTLTAVAGGDEEGEPSDEEDDNNASDQESVTRTKSSRSQPSSRSRSRRKNSANAGSGMAAAASSQAEVESPNPDLAKGETVPEDAPISPQLQRFLQGRNLNDEAQQQDDSVLMRRATTQGADTRSYKAPAFLLMRGLWPQQPAGRSRRRRGGRSAMGMLRRVETGGEMPGQRRASVAQGDGDEEEEDEEELETSSEQEDDEPAAKGKSRRRRSKAQKSSNEDEEGSAEESEKGEEGPDISQFFVETVDCSQQSDLPWEDIPELVIKWLKLNLLQHEQAELYNGQKVTTELEGFPEVSVQKLARIVKNFMDFLDEVMVRTRPTKHQMRRNLRKRYREVSERRHSQPEIGQPEVTSSEEEEPAPVRIAWQFPIMMRDADLASGMWDGRLFRGRAGLAPLILPQQGIPPPTFPSQMPLVTELDRPRKVVDDQKPTLAEVLDVPLTAKVMLPDVDQDPWCMAYAAKHGVEVPTGVEGELAEAADQPEAEPESVTELLTSDAAMDKTIRIDEDEADAAANAAEPEAPSGPALITVDLSSLGGPSPAPHSSPEELVPVRVAGPGGFITVARPAGGPVRAPRVAKLSPPKPPPPEAESYVGSVSWNYPSMGPQRPAQGGSARGQSASTGSVAGAKGARQMDAKPSELLQKLLRAADARRAAAIEEASKLPLILSKKDGKEVAGGTVAPLTLSALVKDGSTTGATARAGLQKGLAQLRSEASPPKAPVVLPSIASPRTVGHELRTPRSG